MLRCSAKVAHKPHMWTSLNQFSKAGNFCSNVYTVSPDESELLEEEFVRTSSGSHPQFDGIFLDESDGLTKNVTFTIAFQFELKENSPMKIEKLPQKLEKIFVQGTIFQMALIEFAPLI